MTHEQRNRIAAIAIASALMMPLMVSADDGKSAERLAAEALVDKGMALSDGSKQEEDFYLQAYETDQTYARPLFDLGLVYSDRRMYQVAITYFKQFLEFEPESLPGLYQIAGCYDNMGKDAQALDAYTRYLRQVAEAGAVPEDENAYVDFAVRAVRRISGRDSTRLASAPPGMQVVSRSEQIDGLMEQYNGASPEEIVEFLSRPRIRASNFRLESGPVYANSSILFQQNSAELLPSSYDALDRVAEALMNEKLSSFKMAIAGHASTEGDEAHNDELSLARAQSVKKYLVREYNIDPMRLDVEAYGEQIPLIAPEQSEADRKHNRRVEFENTGLRVEVVDQNETLPQ